jgi:hypothetical protein
MAEITLIYVNRVRITARGALYEARLNSPIGPILIGLSPEPMLAACRALVAMGRSGPAEVWDAKRPFPRLSGDIAQLARLTVDENRRGFRRWQPFPVRASGEFSADLEAGLPDIPESETAVLARRRA